MQRPDERWRGVVTAREFRGDEAILRIKPESGDQIRRRRSFSTLPAGARVEPKRCTDDGDYGLWGGLDASEIGEIHRDHVARALHCLQIQPRVRSQQRSLGRCDLQQRRVS